MFERAGIDTPLLHSDARQFIALNLPHDNLVATEDGFIRTHNGEFVCDWYAIMVFLEKNAEGFSADMCIENLKGNLPALIDLKNSSTVFNFAVR